MSKNKKNKKNKKEKWLVLQHNGVMFPPKYIYHNIPIIYNNKKIYLTPKQEEPATMYASMLHTDYVTKDIFNKNFWNDWKKILGKNHPIKSLEKCNFSLIYKYLLKEKEKKKKLNKKTKKKLKEEKEHLHNKYKFCIIDGKKEKVENFCVEPPGLFRGRGNNPKMGKIKKRIYPKDVTLNLGPHSKIPKLPNKQQWCEIIHDNSKIWLACWKDSINNTIKYVFPSSQSQIRTKNDMEKYEFAKKLGKKISKIRTYNNKLLKSKNKKISQLSTILYFIDNLALRAGNEKKQNETDTVGCCSLRVEHIKLQLPRKVHLDFLGKDSIRYQNTFNVSPQVFINLKTFTKNKNKKDKLFHLVTTGFFNKYLQYYIPNLTAKVFRTYNASSTLDKELYKLNINNLDSDNIQNELILFYNNANKKVALLCNHQKALPKGYSSQMKKINDMIDDKINKLNLLEKEYKAFKKNTWHNFYKKNKKNMNRTKPLTEKMYIKRIDTLYDKISDLETKAELKEENKTIALGTSKINYLDPRITVAYCKRTNTPIEKLFSKNLIQKFQWAMNTKKNYRF